MSSSVFELGVLLSLNDQMSGSIGNIKSRWGSLTEQLKISKTAAEQVERGIGRLLPAIATFSLAGKGFSLAKDMALAGVEVGRLEGNLASLGMSVSDVASIRHETAGMTGEFGIAQERLLAGVYDLKSAASDLDNVSLAGFAKQVQLTALATKGNFEELSKTFGMVYNQFRDKYKNLDDVQFGRNMGNSIAWAANRFRADGSSINQALTSLGSSGAAAGLKFEEQMAVVGRLLNTMNPETAGTSLRTFLTKLPEAAKKLKLDAYDANGKIKPLAGILEQIAKKYPNMNQSGALLNNAFTEEGVKALKELVPHLDKVKAEVKEIQTASANSDFSFLDNAAKANLGPLGATLDRLTHGASAFWKSMGGGLGVTLNRVLEPLADLVERLNKLPESAKSGLGSLLTYTTGIFTLVSGWKMLGAVMGIWNGLSTLNGMNAVQAGMKIMGWEIGNLTNRSKSYYDVATGVTTAFKSNAAKVGILTSLTNRLSFSEMRNTAVRNAGNLAKGINLSLLGYEATALRVSAVLKGVLSGKIGILTAMQWAYNAALAANPIGLVVLGLAALTVATMGAYYAYKTTNDEWSKPINLNTEGAVAQLESLRSEYEKLHVSTKGLDEVKKLAEGKRTVTVAEVANWSGELKLDNKELYTQIELLNELRRKASSGGDLAGVAEIDTKLAALKSVHTMLQSHKGGEFFKEKDLKFLEGVKNLRIMIGLPTAELDLAMERIKSGKSVYFNLDETFGDRVDANMKSLSYLGTVTKDLFSSAGSEIYANLKMADAEFNGLAERSRLKLDENINWAKAELGSLAESSKLKLAGIWDGLEEGLTAKWNQTLASFNAKLDSLDSWITGLKIKGRKAGTGLVLAFKEGLLENFGLPVKTIEALFGAIAAYMPHSDADKGPLSAITASGKALPETFAYGMLQGIPSITPVMTEMAAGAMPPLPAATPLMSSGAESPMRGLVQFMFQNMIGEVHLPDGSGGGGSVEDIAGLLAHAIYSDIAKVGGTA